MAFTPFLSKQVEPLPIHIGEQTFTVYYKPYAFTMRERAELLPEGFSELPVVEQQQIVVDLLTKLVERADWVDEDGNPLGWSREVLDSIPARILEQIMTPVVNAVFNPAGDHKSNG